AQLPVHSTTALRLRSGAIQPSELTTAVWQSLLQQSEKTGADQPYGPAATIESLDDARIDGLTFEQIVPRLERRARAGENDSADPSGRANDEDSRLFLALTATFRQNPSKVALAIAKVRSKSPAAPVLLDALASSGSAVGQSALVDL